MNAMRSTALLATIALILFIKIINGQNNGLVYNENFESNNPVSQQQPMFTYAMVQELINQNGNIAPKPAPNINQPQLLMQSNAAPTSPTQQIPPDLQQQPLQVQQYLQLQNPLQVQETPVLQQALQQPQMQPLLQTQNPIQRHFDTQSPVLPLQDILLQSQIQNQPQLQLPLISEPPLTQQPLQYLQSLQTQQPLQYPQTQQPLQYLQSLQTQQPLQYPQTQQSLVLQQTFQPLDSLQTIQPLQQLQSQQNCPQRPLTLPETKSVVDTPYTYQINSDPPNSQIEVKWQSSNPQVVLNTDNLYNSQNLNMQPLHTSINYPVEVIPNAQKAADIAQEIPSLRYYVLPQQSATPSVTLATALPVSNCNSVASIPSNCVKAAEETYVPFIPPYNYVISIPEVKYSVPEISNSVNSIPPTPTILTIPSPPIQSATQVSYYNQGSDCRQNEYINQNSGFLYTEPSQIPVVLNQPTAVTSSQPSILSSIPTSILQTPSVPSSYKFSPGYPVGNMAPAYTRQKSSPTLKSLLPLIFQLLKEKIASSGYRSDCPCECKNDSTYNKLDVASGYSSQKDYGSCENDATPDTVSEEIDSTECVRKTKSCEQDKQVSLEESCEILEEEDSDEEEIDDDENS